MHWSPFTEIGYAKIIIRIDYDLKMNFVKTEAIAIKSQYSLNILRIWFQSLQFKLLLILKLDKISMNMISMCILFVLSFYHSNPQILKNKRHFKCQFYNHKLM